MYSWKNISNMESQNFKCGFCENKVASIIGLLNEDISYSIYFCPECIKPNFFYLNTQVPAPLLGNAVKKLPKEIKSIYNEIRKCTGINAYTSAVLSSRKLLMHIAVEKGASIGKNFFYYVDYLSTKGYVPPDGKEWVDHIRTKGNEANHEIVLMNKEDALNLIIFIEMLLKFIYEFKKLIKKINK